MLIAMMACVVLSTSMAVRYGAKVWLMGGEQVSSLMPEDSKVLDSLQHIKCRRSLNHAHITTKSLDNIPSQNNNSSLTQKLSPV